MSTDRPAFGGGTANGCDVETLSPRGKGVDHRGAIVVDADADERDQAPAVVVNTPPVKCGEWVAYTDEEGEEVTVADDNPAYDADDEVVVVVYAEDLDRVRPKYDGSEAIPLASISCRTYAFPPHRLRRVGHVAEEAEDTRKTATEGAPSEEEDSYPTLDAIAERVDGDVVVEDGAAVVAIEKLGVTHYISADGSVSDGPMSDKIAEATAEVLRGGTE